MKIILVLFLFFCLIETPFCLVDYSDSKGSSTISFDKKSKRGSSSRSSKKLSVKSSKRSNSSSVMSGRFNINSGMELLSVESNDSNGKVAMYKLNGRFSTPYNFFLDCSHWYASSDDQKMAEESGTQPGNTTVLIGLNWLRMGRAEDMATIDFIGGASFKGKRNDFASSRLDKIVGIETSKRFFNFAIGFGYKVRLTGAPSNPAEMDIGHIQEISGAIGWVVSHDISFEIEAVSYKIAASSEMERSEKLDQKISFGYVAPRLILGIFPMVELEMGARFRTKKVGDVDKLLGARLWELHGSYGNSVFAGFNLSL